MKLWDISGVAAFGKFGWMSGILVVILILLGELVLVSKRVGEATVGVAAVGA